MNICSCFLLKEYCLFKKVMAAFEIGIKNFNVPALFLYLRAVKFQNL